MGLMLDWFSVTVTAMTKAARLIIKAKSGMWERNTMTNSVAINVSNPELVDSYTG